MEITCVLTFVALKLFFGAHIFYSMYITWLDTLTVKDTIIAR